MVQGGGFAWIDNFEDGGLVCGEFDRICHTMRAFHHDLSEVCLFNQIFERNSIPNASEGELNVGRCCCGCDPVRGW